MADIRLLSTVVPYAEPEKNKDEGDMSSELPPPPRDAPRTDGDCAGTLSSTLPMAAVSDAALAATMLHG